MNYITARYVNSDEYIKKINESIESLKGSINNLKYLKESALKDKEKYIKSFNKTIGELEHIKEYLETHIYLHKEDFIRFIKKFNYEFTFKGYVYIKVD